MVCRRESIECRDERLRRILARTAREAPSPLRSESATRALREDESGGSRGPGTGMRRDMLPRVERERKCVVEDGSSAGRSGLGSLGVPCLLVVPGPAGDEMDRFKVLDINGLKKGVDDSLCTLAPSGVRGDGGASICSAEDNQGLCCRLSEDSAGVKAMDGIDDVGPRE